MILRKSNRVGRFSLSDDFISDAASHITAEGDAEFFAIFRRCVVVRAECQYATRCIEYVAFCDQFDEVENGFSLPVYDIDITRSESLMGGVPVVTFEPKFTRRKECA